MSAPVQLTRPRWPIRVARAWARVPASSILNGTDDSVGSVEADLPARMRAALASMTGRFMADDGSVDYVALGASSVYSDYVQLANALWRFDLGALAEDAVRKAFWLNLYNSLILHAVIDHQLQKAPQRGMFERAAYAVSGYRFSANDIEHGILRANRPHVLALGTQFGRGDARLAYSVTVFDARIHFALNCAARSCPPIRAYEPARLDQQLDLAAALFLNGGQAVLDRATMRVGLSRLFSFYGPDFGGGVLGLGGNDRLLLYAARYLADADDRAFVQMHARQLRVHFLPYDWSLNANDISPQSHSA
ncbi:MAG TPA: DUF547 domain-containing protein [Candidatus Limnocylindrales bacterium]|nr:DUF547 domain-containing protein [Candidatus Limnocylindrales bacterium]